MDKFTYFEEALRQGDAEGMVDQGGGPMPYFTDPRTGEQRILNFFPTPHNHPMMLASPARKVANIPESMFRDFTAETIIPIADQNGRGACVCFATVCAMLKLMAMMGLPVPPLSQWFLYSMVNGGVDAGSSIGDGMQAAVTVGVPEDKYATYGQIRPKGISQAAMSAPKWQFEGVESLGSGNADEIIQYVAERGVLVLDVRAGNWFDTDSNGSVAFGRGMTNHAVAVGGGLRKFNGEWQPLVTNSWATTWGQKGRGWLTQNHLKNTQDVWKPSGMKLRGDFPLPPVAPV